MSKTRLRPSEAKKARKPGPTIVEVRAPTLRGVRGATCIAVIADEVAFWRSEESANPDVEILNVVRPARATTGGPLIASLRPTLVVAPYGTLIGVRTVPKATR